MGNGRGAKLSAPFDIVREPDSPGNPTIGELLVEGIHFTWTLELPWLGNQHYVSCIPTGVYQVKMLPSAHFHCLMPHILNVPGRDAEEIHGANSVRDLLGCVGLGDTRGPNYTLAYPAHPASVRFNAWMESVGGEATMTISYQPTTRAPAGAT
jgi:hypothetical protein